MVGIAAVGIVDFAAVGTDVIEIAAVGVVAVGIVDCTGTVEDFADSTPVLEWLAKFPNATDRIDDDQSQEACLAACFGDAELALPGVDIALQRPR